MTGNRRLIAAGAAVVVAVLLAAAVFAGVRWWLDSQRTELERAMAMAPDDAQRFSWTDWAGVRDELDLDLGTDPSSSDILDLVDRGFEADLTSTSALADSTQVMQAELGFSPATVEWELFTQSEAGAAVTLGLPESVDFDDLAAGLDRLGYAEPDSETGVWRGNPDLLAQVGQLTPELTFLALDSDARVVVGSDTLEGAEAAAEAATEEKGPGGGLGEVVSSTADEREPLTGAFYTGDQVCVALSMSQADTVDQDQADELIAAAGEIDPLTGFAMTKEPGGDLWVAMAFETEEQAKTNADTRSVLAAGPAPGQGGDFADRFELGPVTAEGLVVTMELQPVEGNYVLSDLSNGPVLFATC